MKRSHFGTLMPLSVGASIPLLSPDMLSTLNCFALAFRVHNMKTDAGRRRKIENFVAMLSRGETIYPQRRE